ncbi:MAG: hypothetical protein Q7R40_13810 [Phaeospirillum sp.]|nr:hypothetical protein [Phaeospirillum sp.]
MASTARQAMFVSEQLEVAQAERPFTEKLGSFAKLSPSVSLPFGVILAAPQDLRGPALAWLAGGGAAFLFGCLAEFPDNFEVELHPQADITLTVDRRGHGSFGNVEDCAAALRALPRARLVQLTLPCVAGRMVGCVRLINLAAIAERPGLVGNLIAETCLVVSARGRTPWSSEEVEGVTELSAGIGAVLPVRLGAALPAPPYPPIPVLLPEIGIDDESAPLPPFFAPDAVQRQVLICCRESRRLRLLLEAFGGQYEREVRQSNALRMKEDRTARSFEDVARGRDFRGEMDRIRVFFSDDLRRIVEQIGEANRDATLPQGAIVQGCKQAIDAVSTDDIEFEETPSNLILRLRQETLDSLSRSCGDLLRSRLQGDIAALRASLKEVETQVNQMILQFAASPVSLNLAIPEEGELWRKMIEMISLEIRYRGEMPKRGFFSRISEGRQPVFMMLMVGSMAGTAFGFNVRTRPVMLILFIIFLMAVAYTFVSWRKQDGARMDKELERVREALSMEFKRLVAEVQREKMNRIQAYFDELRRDVERRLDSCMRDVQKAETERAADERKESRTKQRTVEQRIRELSSLGAQMSKLLVTCGEIERKCVQAAAKAVIVPA